MVSRFESSILQIEDFIMRPVCLSNLNALEKIWTDTEITRFLPSRGVPIPQKDIEKSLQSFVEHWQQRGYGIWAIIEEDISQMIGYCGLRYLNELDEVEILYGLDKTHWRKGIMTQAVKASISYGFNRADLNKLIAMTLPENYASKRVIEKAGLNFEKQIRMFNLDVLYYSLIRSPAQ